MLVGDEAQAIDSQLTNYTTHAEARGRSPPSARC
jgi:hypothetical protein